MGGRVKKWSKKGSTTIDVVSYALEVSVNGVTCVFLVHFRSSDTFFILSTGLTVNIHVSTKHVWLAIILSCIKPCITVPTTATAMLLYHIYLFYNIVILLLAYIFQYLIYFIAHIFIYLILLYTCITMWFKDGVIFMRSMTAALEQLHWLPVRYRIEYTILVIVFRALRDRMPTYIASLITPYVPRRALRSADRALLVVPRHNLERYGRRSFSRAGPTLWNALSEDLRSTECMN